MNEDNITTEFIQQPTGFIIADTDLTIGKVIVNDIEITSIEDWEKVTNSLNDLKQQNAELKEENENLRKKNRVYKATIKGQIKKIEELRIGKQTSKKVHKERNKKIEEENIILHKKIDKAIDLNSQIIEDIKNFSIPTTAAVYSGDCIIDIAERNIEKLKGSDKNE